MRKTVQEVQAEIEKLEEMKPKIIPVTAFGESNTDAIQAQIDTLKKRWDEDDIYDEFPDGEGDMNVRNSALSAMQWRNEGQTEDGEESLSEGWKHLVR